MPITHLSTLPSYQYFVCSCPPVFSLSTEWLRLRVVGWGDKQINETLESDTRHWGGGKEQESQSGTTELSKERIPAPRRCLELCGWHWVPIFHHLASPACPPWLNWPELISWAAPVAATRAGAESLLSLGLAECVILQKSNTNFILFSQNILNSTAFMFTTTTMEATNKQQM